MSIWPHSESDNLILGVAPATITNKLVSVFRVSESCGMMVGSKVKFTKTLNDYHRIDAVV